MYVSVRLCLCKIIKYAIELEKLDDFLKIKQQKNSMWTLEKNHKHMAKNPQTLKYHSPRMVTLKWPGAERNVLTLSR